MKPMIAMGFDFGLRYLGIAVGQTITGTARGITTLECRSGVPNWRELKRVIAEHQPNHLVVGLPLNVDGSHGVMAEPAITFAQTLERKMAISVSLQDERFTSKEADRGLQDAQNFGQATTDHELAACLITQDWLQKNS